MTRGISGSIELPVSEVGQIAPSVVPERTREGTPQADSTGSRSPTPVGYRSRISRPHSQTTPFHDWTRCVQRAMGTKVLARQSRKQSNGFLATNLTNKARMIFAAQRFVIDSCNSWIT